MNYTSLGYSSTDALNYATLPVGELLEEIDPLGNVTHYQYGTTQFQTGTDDILGSFGQVTAVTTAYNTPDAATVHYGYDGNGNQILMTDALGNETDYTYERAW